MSIQVKDKVALVTGANRGIGRAIAESFLEHGAKKVYLAVRNPESTIELAQKYGERVVTLQVDVSNADSIASLAQSAQDTQIVVNNAGILRTADPLAENAETALSEELEVNLYGLLRVANAFAPILEQQSDAALVQLNSVASIKNFHPFSTYSASKAAAYSITQGLRESFAEKNVSVMSVHPGPIDTDMASQAGFEASDSASVVAEAIVNGLQEDQFLVFPDTMAKDFEAAYQSYAEALIKPLGLVE